VPRPCCAQDNSDFDESSKRTEPSLDHSPVGTKNGRLNMKELFKTDKPLGPEYYAEINRGKRGRFNKKGTNFRKRQEKLKYNDWKPEEDILLMKLCNSQFHKKWKKIALLIGDKTPRKCAYRIKKLEKHMHNFEIMKSKLNICGEQDLLIEYKLQLGKLLKAPPKKKKKMKKLKKHAVQYNIDLALTLDHFQNLQIVEKKPEVERNSKVTNL
jgi:hypothetical protein